MYDDTIAAIATAPGEAGIGTVRMSGPDTAPILSRIFVPAYGKPLQPGRMESHKLVFGHVRDPRSGDKVDEVLAVLMRAPHSYTREDVVEIDCHGGTVPLQRVLALCLREGARMAQPGEFTLRAFLNGRLDLAQAEAVLDVVKARTGEGLRLAVEQLGGGLSARVKGVRAKLLHALAHLEATIDFPEDDVPPADVSPELRDALGDLQALIKSASTGIVMRQGVRTALVGRPNVGKSSLLNALLRTERAIVTPIPGTTRDTLEEVANVRGVPLVLTDTAGLRKEESTHDPIERIGMDRTRRALSGADLVLMIFDVSEPLTQADREMVEEVRERAPSLAVAVVNKSDLPQKLDEGELRRALTGVGGRESGVGDQSSVGGQSSVVSRQSPEETDRHSVLVVSASATAPGGTDELEERLAELVLSGRATPGPGEVAVTSVRHLDALRRAEEQVLAALDSTAASAPAAMVAVDLHAALGALGEITGETVGEDLLDEIFRNFCIGK